MSKPLAALAALLLTQLLSGSAAGADLAAHSAEFRRGVLKVTDGVYVAVGFGLANSVLLKGTDGVVIVDTLECAEPAREALAAFRKITAKPVKAIIYTHHHTDHVFGARVFAAGARPEVYAHRSLPTSFSRSLTGVRRAIATRSTRMYGLALGDRRAPNAGVGPQLALNSGSTLAYLPPTKTFTDTLDLQVAGLSLQLVHAPGETDDHLFVWLPQKKVLLCGDNYYRSFPNLYTIRGTSYRHVRRWISSLDRMRDLKAEFLVPGHTRPLSGAAHVQAVLTDYRDAIQYVHDQTLRGLNRGQTADELAASIKLPPHLARSPYLQEYYGKVTWSVRSICDGHLGWFDGDAAHLLPLPPKERAERMAALAGGTEALLRRAGEAAAKKDHRWALELVGYLLRLDPASKKARELRAQSLAALGEAQQNAPARNYYLTQGKEAREGIVVRSPVKLNRETAHALALASLFEMTATNLDPEASKDARRSVVFRCGDTGAVFTVHVRRGVAEVRARLDPGTDLIATADSGTWKEVLTHMLKVGDALAGGRVKVEGEGKVLREFLALFQIK